MKNLRCDVVHIAAAAVVWKKEQEKVFLLTDDKDDDVFHQRALSKKIFLKYLFSSAKFSFLILKCLFFKKTVIYFFTTTLNFFIKCILLKIFHLSTFSWYAFPHFLLHFFNFSIQKVQFFYSPRKSMKFKHRGRCVLNFIVFLAFYLP